MSAAAASIGVVGRAVHGMFPWHGLGRSAVEGSKTARSSARADWSSRHMRSRPVAARTSGLSPSLAHRTSV
jgi:hypothetical protein